MNVDIRKPIESDVDSLSSHSSSDSEDDIDEERLKEAEKNVVVFKKQISQNYLDYDAHVGLIKALRLLGEFNDLRKARQDMNKCYPLSPDLWMDWLKDEEKICTESEEKKFVISLFEKAVAEYMSVIVWVEYVMFILGCGDIKETRSVCDRALMAVGIHVAEGAMIWQAVSLVEQQIYVNLQSGGEEEKVAEQKKRLQSLYRRQARVSLLNVERESFFSEASKWFDEDLDPNMESDFEKSLEKLRGKSAHENRLVKAESDTEKLEAYRKYIDYVIKHDTPTGVQNVYERTVTDLCLNATLWEEYVRFVMDQFRFADYVVLPVCERSQRNCPWSGILCELRITAFQSFNNLPPADVLSRTRDCIDKIVSSGVTDKDELMQAWMAYLVSLRRRIGLKNESVNNELLKFYELCDEAHNCIEDACEGEGDLSCEILRFKARVGLVASKDIDNCRKVWNEKVMKQNNNFKNMDLWLEYIRLERQYGTEMHTRKLFRRALEYAWDDVELIGKAFRAFEQEVGALETMEEFNKRYKDRLSIVNKRRMEEGTSERNKGGKYVKKIEMEKKNLKERDKGYSRTIQRGKNVAPTHKIPVINIQKASLRDEIEPPPGYKRSLDEDVGSPAKKTKTESVEKHGEFVKHDHSNDHRSVFLSNLDYATTPAQIAPIFSSCGEQEDLRLVKDFKGRSKGFGYLIFKESSSVAEALKLDRTPIGSRPLFVSKCSVSQREKAFKFNVGEEKTKLFVRGLPFSMNEQQVKDVFAAHGDVKAIRLVTLRNGCSKGVCFVEFNDAKTAEYVRQKLDQTVHDEKTITVLISNPSATEQKKTFSLDKTSQPTVTATGTQKPILALMPRAILRKKPLAVTKKNETNGNVVEAMEVEDSASDLNKVKPMSNQDFRDMLLKK